MTIENPTRDDLRPLRGKQVVVLAGSIAYHGEIIGVSKKSLIMITGKFDDERTVPLDRITKVTVRQEKQEA